MKLLKDEVFKDGKKISSKVFEVEHVQKMQITEEQIDLQIAQLTATLAKLTAMKAQMNHKEEKNGGA